MLSVLYISAKTLELFMGHGHGGKSKRKESSGVAVGSVKGRLVDQTTDCFYVTMMPSLVSQFEEAQGLKCQGVAVKEAVCLPGEGCGNTNRSTLGHCLGAYVLHL